MAVTAAMHLLFLVAFSWMLVEGLLLWSKVVAVRMRPGPRMTLYYATGWGEAPLLPTPALFPTLPRMASVAVPPHPTPTPPDPHLHLAPSTPIPDASSVSSAQSPSSFTQPQPFLTLSTPTTSTPHC